MPPEKTAGQKSTAASGSSSSDSESEGKSTSSGVPNQAAMDQFLKFMRNEVDNPPNTSELFKIPEDVSPEWQAFFEKVAAYYERQCGENRHALISLEKRSWILEDEKLSEFEMLMSATGMKEKGNTEFKNQNIQAAQLHYMSAISTFPTPDAMNNVAACALKLNQFQIAVDFTTKALDMDLFTSQSSVAKAHFRRATGFLHLGRFVEAMRDATRALSLSPGDASITVLQTRIFDTMNAVRPADVDAYLREQPQPPAQMRFGEGLNWAQTNGQYMRIPAAILRDMDTNSNPPVY